MTTTNIQGVSIQDLTDTPTATCCVCTWAAVATITHTPCKGSGLVCTVHGLMLQQAIALNTTDWECPWCGGVDLPAYEFVVRPA